jgi:hypothetical protein
MVRILSRGTTIQPYLSFTHRKQLDVQPGNILFSFPNMDSFPESHFQTDITQPQTISDPVKRVDGKVDLWSPRYTAIPQPLTSLATLEADFTIRISDMGAGQYFRTKYRRCSPLTGHFSMSRHCRHHYPHNSRCPARPRTHLRQILGYEHRHLELWVSGM